MKLDVAESLRLASSALRSRQEVHDRGVSDRALHRGLVDGTWVRARRGWFVEGSVWRSFTPEQRHLAQISACASSARNTPTFSHLSAAILLGLPVYGFRRSPVHTIGLPGRQLNSSRETTRHAADFERSELAALLGIRHTGLARTVIDVGRTSSPEVAICCADAALRTVSHRTDIQEKWRDHLVQSVKESPHVPGNLAAVRALSLSDGSAESPVESVSRYYLDVLGIRYRTQVSVPSEGGGELRIDFEFIDHGTFGEVDGKVKYLDEDLRNGRTVEEVLLAEKKRENWITGSTGKRVIRWGAEDLVSLETFARKLRSFGIIPPVVRVPA